MTKIPVLAALLFCNVFPYEYLSAHFLDRVHNSQEILYGDVVRYYDSLLVRHESPVIRIEKCKFVESALYDSYEEENPKQEAWDSCFQNLLARYPNDARVVAYRLDHKYGDSVIVHGELALERAKSGILTGMDSLTMASIHRSLAVAYSVKDSARLALKASYEAQKLEDTIHVDLLIAQQWNKIGNGDEARKALFRGETRLGKWENNQAADILLKLGYPRDAAYFYRKALGDTTLYPNYVGLAKALERAGEIDSARKYNVLALGKQYGKGQALRRQFEFDLQHSKGRLAMASYRAFRDQGFRVDPFSFHRLRLLALKPFQPIMLRELKGLGLLILMLLVLALAPYMWVLPLHYLDTQWFAKRRPPQAVRFTYKHFWICSSAIYATAFIATGFFQHNVIDHAMRLASKFGAQELPSDWENAHFLVAFILLTGFFTLIFCLRTKAAFLFKRKVSPVSALLYVLGALAVFHLVQRLNMAIFPELLKESSGELLNGSVMVLLKSALATIGVAPTVVLVAGVVPLYEEVLFRGVFMESVGKYIPFGLVNCFQALGFASLHGSLRLFPTFFIMGIILGWLARKTGSLFVPILVHGANNLIAAGTLWWVLGRLGRLH